MSYHRVPFIRSPLGKPKKGANPEEAPIETRDETLFDNPQFEHYEQTTNIQLFFDLFFVANLTTFTNRHEINSLDKLGSYIGFFCILWFTWCQVTLYDVRFATDSVMERIAHACHFGVMIGLAIVGPQFDPNAIANDIIDTTDIDPNDTYWFSFQQLSLILMASRIVLFVQYGFTMFFTWKYRKTRLPLALVMASLGIAAGLYLAFSFFFSTESNANAYIVWYVVAVFEVGANIVIAGRWDILSFRDTHLVERMTCLTLIVLGEGVIGLTSRIALIEDLDFLFSAGAIGTIISAVLIIYLIYQLYFDNVQMENFGTNRQQIWAFLHFPFHLALVLLMEGVNQFIIWRHVIEMLDWVFGPINALPDDATYEQYYNTLEQTVYDTYNVFWPKTNDTGVIDEVLAALDKLRPPTNATLENLTESSDTIELELFKVVLEDYGFEPPQDLTGLSLNDKFNAYYNVFTLIFGYFFVAAGLVLIGIGILSWLSMLKGERTWRHYIGIVSNFIIGLGVALLSIMVISNDSDNLGSSVWTLPLLAFALFIALLLNQVPIRLGQGEKKVA